MKYSFDHTNLKYRRIRESRRKRLYRATRLVLMFFMIISAVNLIVALRYYTPSVSYLERTRDSQLAKYEVLKGE